MIRVIAFLILVALLALGVVWFADRPGDVSVVWLGYRIETSVMVAVLAITLIVIVAVALWSLLRLLWRSPHHVSRFLRHRRADKGYRAISRGLIAIGVGDTRLALKASQEARRLAPGDPLALLLAAQSAQLSGEPGEAERAFRAMAEREDTRLLGLRGLFIEAQRRDDAVAARRYAEQAAQTEGGVNWASQAVLEFRSTAGDWLGALDLLERMKGGLDKADYRRRRAVLLTARAIALAENDRDVSHEAALEAVKLAPSLVPAAALAGRQLSEMGERRKAARILDAAWRAHPHPDLAAAYAETRLGASARERLTRIRALADKTPGHIEGALAVARAALDAKEFGVARAALEPFASSPTRRVAELMAELEHEERGDAGRSRQWMARALHAAPDPVWTADGVVSENWLPVSPASGRLDAFQWKVPVAEIGMARPVVEIEPAPPEPTPPEPAPVSPPEAAAPVKADMPAVAEPASRPKTRAARPRGDKPRTAEPVIPLVRAPDDPGLDVTEANQPLDGDPVPTRTADPLAPVESRQTWLKKLFR
jgi:HemY protein